MLAPHQSWENLLWHERYRCIYAVVPKAGTSSIKRWFIATHPNLPRPAPGCNLHDHVRGHFTMNRMPHSEAVEKLRDPTVLRFTFVRNPWQRLVSGYLDKVVGVEPVARPTIRRHYRSSFLGKVSWRAHRLTGMLDQVFRKGVTFRQFVAALAREHPAAINPHFKPQGRILQGIPLDVIGRIENFGEDFTAIQSRIGDATATLVAHSQHYTEGIEQDFVADWSPGQLRSLEAFPNWLRFYPPDVADIVRNVFAEDFRLFGYSSELPAVSRAA